MSRAGEQSHPMLKGSCYFLLPGEKIAKDHKNHAGQLITVQMKKKKNARHGNFSPGSCAGLLTGQSATDLFIRTGMKK
jgi:hypothetical protein